MAAHCWPLLSPVHRMLRPRGWAIVRGLATTFFCVMTLTGCPDDETTTPPEELPDGAEVEVVTPVQAIDETPLVDTPIPDGTVWSTINADAFLRNATQGPIRVQARPLRDTITIRDCELLLSAPTTMLRETLFASTRIWEMPSNSHLALLNQAPTQPCNAVWINIDGLTPRIAVWRTEDIDYRPIPGGGGLFNLDTACDLGGPPIPLEAVVWIDHP